MAKAHHVALIMLLTALSVPLFLRTEPVSRAMADGPKSATEPARLSNQVIIHGVRRDNTSMGPAMNLSDGREVVTSYVGPEEQRAALEQNRAEPLSLASADFDEDGVPDLISGYGYQGRGIVTVLRGNLDAIYPHSPEAQKRKANGTSTEAPFISPGRAFATPALADFIGAGDFDGDSHWDVVVASRGYNHLYLLSGDGHGGLGTPREIPLPGVLTAFVTGEINRRDGLTDIVVSVAGSDGPAVLVFEGPEGALRASPEQIPLPAVATALALDQLDDEYATDLAVAAGNELLIVHGRDRKLSLDREQQAAVKAASIETRLFNEPIQSLAAGRFNGTERTNLAVALQDGAVHFLSRPRNERLRQSATPEIGLWRDEVLSASGGPLKGKLVPARLSGKSADDLVGIGNGSLHILAKAVAETSSSQGQPVALDQDDGHTVDLLPMRLNQSGLDGLVVLVSGESAPVVMYPEASMTFTVNSTADTDDGSCDLANCTLREAINAANANPGEDRILFSIGSGVKTINLTSLLPNLTDTVTIDGTTQPGFAGAPLIELKGGLLFRASNCVVRGLVIGSIEFNSPATVASGGIVEGNYIGTDITGMVGLNAANPLRIFGTINNRVGGTVTQSRNIIAGDVRIQDGLGAPDANVIQGNYIGTDVSGTLFLGGTVVIVNGSNETVGGTTAGARNVLMGVSILVQGFRATGSLIQGNFVGTDASGTRALGGAGVSLNANLSSGGFIRGTTVGGTTASARNVVSGGGGIHLAFEEVLDNQIQGNYIGVDVTGSLALGNGGNGVSINALAYDNTIGGSVAGARNIISGNAGSGVQCASVYRPNHIEGNFIGTDSTGSVKLGNMGDGVNLSGTEGQGIGGNVISNNGRHGVYIIYGGSHNEAYAYIANNHIGTDATGIADMGNAYDGVFIDIQSSQNTIIQNTIAFNRANGINIPGTSSSSSVRNLIESNSIFSNAALGINLGDSGITANDLQDPDRGGNTLQNFPVLTSFSSSNATQSTARAVEIHAPRRGSPLSAEVTSTVNGTLNSTPGTTFTIDWYFSADSQCRDHQAGSAPLTSGMITGITTNSSGDATFSFPFVFPPGITSGVINATATDLNRNTSEFSACLPVVAPTFQFSTGSYSVAEDAGSVIINVTRAGDNSSPAKVDYATANGTADQRSDYILAAGTLTFGAGETVKSFRVLVTDDVSIEGNESVLLTLSNPTAAFLGNPSAATLTIVDNDTSAPSTNPLDDPAFFVRQHYYDFLDRIPDQGGWDYWTGQITQCGGDPACSRNKRVDVSNAFFYELEYQQTGLYVYRLYRAAFGNNQPLPNPHPDPNFPGENRKQPGYAAFASDRARVKGGANLAQSQLDLAKAFVQRLEFITRYGSLDGPAFVDAILATLNYDIGVDLMSQRQALIDLFNHGGRGEVLYRLADDSQTNPINNRALIDAEYNRAFVVTQYFGYLRRNPDMAGFSFWLGQINSAPLRDVAKQHAMVCSFITSAEYQQRFSPIVTHTNAECQASPTPVQNGKIAFLSSRDSGGFSDEIYTMNAFGSEPARLTFNVPNHEFPREFVWSPDGSRIAYQLMGLDRERIVVMNADGSAARNLTNGTTDEFSPAWSPDGSMIAFEREDGIFVARMSDGVVTKLANSRSRFPLWSPEGSRIAYVVETNSLAQIFVMNADGSNQTNLSNTHTYDVGHRWSPDGSRLLFIRRTEPGAYGDLFVMNSDGLNQQKLTISQSFGFAADWSPNGNKIAFSSDQTGLAQIYTMNADGSGLTRLTNNSAQDGGPQWSPDNSKIVFVSDRDHSGSFDIYIMNSDGSNQTRLTRDSGDNESPRWQFRRVGLHHRG